MGSCRIQRPIGKAVKAGIATHGDTFIQVTHNEIDGEIVKYEGEKGDLHIHLICEEGDGDGINVGEILDNLQTQLNDLAGLQEQIDLIQVELSDLSEYIEQNPIEITIIGEN
jgi:hypothetical protein